MDAEVPDRADAVEIDGVHHSIRFRSVSFQYESKAVIAGVDLEVNAGEVIAIVGRSGEGKSTLVDLLLVQSKSMDVTCAPSNGNR